MKEAWVSALRKYRFLWMLASAALTGLCVVLPMCGFLEWISLVPAALVLFIMAEDRSVRLRRFYGYGFFFFMCYYVVNYHWFLAMYPLAFLNISKGLAAGIVAFSWLGLSALQASGGAFVFLVAAICLRSRTTVKMPLLAPFLLCAIWTFFEWTQTLGWVGVPWGRLSLGQTAYLPMIQSASLFGSYFVTFLLLCTNFCIAYLLLHVRARRICAFCAAGACLGNLLLGTVLCLSDTDTGRSVRVAGIQGNISSKDKFDQSMVDETFRSYRENTEAAVREGAELILWPETAMAYTYSPESLAGRFMAECATENRVTLLAGVFTEDGQDHLYNSIMAIAPDGTVSQTVYSKRHLVPFGEYVPLRPLVEALVPMMTEMATMDLTPGDDPAIFETEVGKLGSIICFDSIYDQLTLDSTRAGAELICLSTNDSWFGDSAAAYMHNAQAKLRAVECGRYLVRAANTGYSTIISPHGEIIADTPILEEGYVIADVTLRSNVTLYVQIGNAFVFFCGAFFAGVLVCGVFLRIKDRGRSAEENPK